MAAGVQSRRKLHSRRTKELPAEASAASSPTTVKKLDLSLAQQRSLIKLQRRAKKTQSGLHSAVRSKTRFSPFGDPIQNTKPSVLEDASSADRKSEEMKHTTLVCGLATAAILPIGWSMMLLFANATGEPIDKKILAYVLVFWVQVAFTVYQLLAKVALSGRSLNPLGFSFVRTVGTAMVLCPVGYLAERKKAIQREKDNPETFMPAVFPGIDMLFSGDIWHFLLLGVYMAANILGWMFALKYTSSAIVAVLQVLCPIIASIISWMLGKEAFTAKMLFGIALCTVGTTTITAQSALHEKIGESPAPCLGIACVFIHALGQALFIIHQSNLLEVGYSTFTVNAGGFAVASFIMAGLMMIPSREFHGGGTWWSNTPYDIFNLVYSVVLAGAFSHSIMGWAAKQIGGSAVMLFMLLQTVLTMIGGRFVLDERINETQMLGACLVLVGLAIYVLVKEPVIKELSCENEKPLKG
jgi:drug/metabolite transporter (DMT)-like permease